MEGQFIIAIGHDSHARVFILILFYYYYYPVEGWNSGTTGNCSIAVLAVATLNGPVIYRA
jgi:hypothetical protein